MMKEKSLEKGQGAESKEDVEGVSLKRRTNTSLRMEESQ